MNHETMKELPAAARPYEKCLAQGPAFLTDAELLSVILRTGTRGRSALDLAGDILCSNKAEAGLHNIMHVSMQRLKEIKGVGKVKAIQVLCIAELSRRIARSSAREKLEFSDPASVADYYMETLRHEEQETVFCMMLNTRNHFLGDCMLSRGSVHTSVLSARDLFLKALEYHAVSVILVHNHPSGDPSPSQEDIQVSRRIARIGEMLEIPLLDHIIIGDRCFVSMKNEGCI